MYDVNVIMMHGNFPL